MLKCDYELLVNDVYGRIFIRLWIYKWIRIWASGETNQLCVAFWQHTLFNALSLPPSSSSSAPHSVRGACEWLHFTSNTFFTNLLLQLKLVKSAKKKMLRSNMELEDKMESIEWFMLSSNVSVALFFFSCCCCSASTHLFMAFVFICLVFLPSPPLSPSFCRSLWYCVASMRFLRSNATLCPFFA